MAKKNDVAGFDPLKIVYRKISELIPCEYNPRRINQKQKMDIKKSLQKFGFADPVLVNTHPDRLNVIIGGNQRTNIASTELGYLEVPCIEMSLTFKEEQELNVRLNKNTAEFDMDILNEYFEREWLEDVGFSESELGKLENDFDKKFESIDNTKAEMPIVPKFSEQYDSVLIFSTNELDYNWLRNVLNLEKRQDYKNSRTGETHVITVKELQEIWEAATYDAGS